MGQLVTEPIVTLAEIAELEFFILRRLKEFTLGNHRSVFKGHGFDFVGLRDWEPGDSMSSIDWAQSSLNNFSPMIVRDREQDSTAAIITVADASLSTRCGIKGSSIALVVARATAAVGISAAMFQDSFGLIAVDAGFRPLAVARPSIGRAHVLHCLDLYQSSLGTDAATGDGDFSTAVTRYLRKPSLVPVISDFLFADAPSIIRICGTLNSVHDVFLVMVDAGFAYPQHAVSAGWVRTFDVETGSTRLLSRKEFGRLTSRVADWQAEVEAVARDAGLEVVKIGLETWEMETALAQFVAERRLRKV